MCVNDQKTILLVEDEAILAMGEKSTLENFGFNVIMVSSGEEAVATVAKTPAIDLILMDINLGSGIDGTEAAAAILREREIPVVFLSSHTEPEIVAKTEKITSYGYVVKGSSVTVLQASIKMAFKLFEAKKLEMEKESRMEIALEALQESEKLYRAIYDQSPIAIELYDAAGIFIHANSACLDMFGIEDMKAIQNFSLFADPNINDEQKEKLHLGETVQYQGPFDFEKVKILDLYPTSREGIIWLDVLITPLGNRADSSTGFLVQIQNITQREFAEAALRESEAKYRKLIETTNTGFVIIDQDGLVLDANPEYVRLSGHHELKEIFGRNVIEWTADSEKEKNAAAVKACLAQKSIRNLEINYVNSKGNVTPIEVNATCMELDGKIQTLTLCRDITERKQAESQGEAALEKLRESEAKYRQLVESLNEGIWMIDEKAVTTFVNPRLAKMLGYTEEEMSGRSIFSFMDEQGVQIATRGLARLQQGIKESYDFELLRKNGARIYVSLETSIITGLDGNHRGAIAGIVDITERKQMESQREAALQELKESKALIDTVVESVPLMIFLKEATDLRFVIFNRAGEELLGHDRQSLLGKNNLDLFPPEQAAHFMAKDREVLDGEAGILDIPEEPIMTAKKGQRLLHTRKVCIRGADGTTKYLLGISEDITARKEAEEEIKRQLAEKEILLREVHHRIKNNIVSIGALISMHLKAVTNPEAIAVLQDASGRVNSMGILYDKLLLTEGYKDVFVKNYVESLADTVITLFPGSARIKLDKRIADFQLDSKRLFPLGIIINELLTNKMKYAFINKDSGLIKISLKNIKNHVTLTIQDNGNELPAGFDINEVKGFGLMLVKMLCKQLVASFSIEKDEGTRCKIEFNI
ncbi:MAG: PAS domain S-box protein [Chrysiogenales bacterium]